MFTVRGQYDLAYLDDIIVFSTTPEEHIKHSGIVFRLLKDAGVTLKLRNCAFFTNRTDYFGHIIRFDPHKVVNHSADAAHKGNRPATITELRFVIELCNMFRRFVPNLARIVSPLSNRLEKSQTKSLGPLRKTSFRHYIA